MLHPVSRYINMLRYLYPLGRSLQKLRLAKFRNLLLAFNATSMILCRLLIKNEISSLSALTQFDKSTYSYNRTYSYR